MEVFIKVSALAVVGVVIISVLRRTLPEMSVVASIALMCAAVAGAAGILFETAEFIETLADWANLESEIVLPIIKTLGISIVARIAADVCRESGVFSAASVVELLGGAVAISFAVPLIFGLLGQITS